MKEYVLEREQWIDADLDRVFEFFADAENLGVITPPWLDFHIETPLPVEMRTGLILEYKIRLASVPQRWVTRIENWDPPRGFVDNQEKGPYRLWHHTHEFRPLGGGVLMTDRVRYVLPFGWLGRIVHAVAIRAALAAIFDYRLHKIRELFATPRLSERAETS